ncbi:MAG: hypothetical protein R2686_00070 [Candidatus Nanopelagicales bacterium]
MILAGSEDLSREIAVTIPLAGFVLVVALLPGLASTRADHHRHCFGAVLVSAAAVDVPIIVLSLVIPIKLLVLTAIGNAASSER